MKIKEYLKESGYRSNWLAKQIPCSACYLSTISRGRAKPSNVMIRRIVEVTNGMVTEEDFEIDKEKDGSKT